MNAPAQAFRAFDALPLEKINVADPRLYQEDLWPPYFARLRREACWRINFNVVCPLADIVFGTYRSRSAPGRLRRFNGPHPPALPRV